MAGPRGGHLEVLPDGERVEEALVLAAERTPFVDASGFASFGQLLELLEGARTLNRRPASPLTSRVLVWGCARRLQGSPFEGFVHEPAFARAALELFFELKSGMATPEEFRLAVEQLAPGRLARARFLAELYARYEAAMAERGLADREDRVRGCLEHLRTRGLPGSLRGLKQLAIRQLHDFPPLRLALLLELARACEKLGIQFVLELPVAGSPALDLALAPVSAAFERLGADVRHVSVERLEPELLGRPLAEVTRALFAEVPRQVEGVGEALTLESAASAADELRLLARHAALEVGRGVPPEQVAIAFRDLGEEAEALEEALLAYGVPARIRRGAPVASTRAGRIALELPLLVDDGYPADRVAALLGSRYLPRLTRGTPASPATLLKLASVRDNRIGAAGKLGAYEVRLTRLVERMAALGDRRASDVRALLDRCRALFRLCDQLPAEGTAGALLAAWWGCLKRSGLLEAVREPEPREAEGTPLGRAVLRALARDQQAAEALEELARDLDAALKEAGAAEQTMNRRRFHRWLADAAQDINLEPRGPRGGAVRVLDLRELPGRAFTHVLLGGVSDGRLPGREIPHPLFPDEDRRGVNAALERSVFRLSASDGDARASTGLAEDRLLFGLGLCAATDSVRVTFGREGASGKEQLRSPFLDELRRVSGARLVERASQALPSLDEVLSEPELRERTALESFGPLEVRTSEPDPAASALSQRFAAEDWYAAARFHAGVERERLSFFTRPDQGEPGRFTGDASGPEVAADFARIFAFGPDKPLSATAADRFGNCAFQGFLTYAIGLKEPESPGEDLDDREKGSFWHAVLQELFPALKQHQLLGKPPEEVPDALIDAALEVAARQAERTAHLGHPALWRIGRERARLMVRRLLGSPSRGLPFDGHQPESPELVFGPESDDPRWREVVVPGLEGQAPIHLKGKIDRLDRGAFGAGIVDYKSGSVTSRQKELRQQLLRSNFQLPIYVYAARAAGEKGQLEAALLSLKDGKALTLSKLLEGAELTLDELLTVDPQRRAQLLESEVPGNLANALHALAAGLRAGRFPIRPHDCGYCKYRPVCRISTRALEEAEG